MATNKTWHDWAHVFINGTGILNTWKWPEIEGLSDFKGHIMHSAKWDHHVDFKGKTVGVIGTGSTSVQIVPELQKIAKHVDVYMRSPTWISPPFGSCKYFPPHQNSLHIKYLRLISLLIKPLYQSYEAETLQILVGVNTSLRKRIRDGSERILNTISSFAKRSKQKLTSYSACTYKIQHSKPNSEIL